MRGVSKEYEKYVGIVNGKRVIYLRLKKVLYGYIQSAIIWYDTVKSYLEEICLKINKYGRILFWLNRDTHSRGTYSTKTI